MTHTILTAAVYAVVIGIVWFALGCLVAFVLSRKAEQRKFDADMTALAEAVGVLPGPVVELDAEYRSPLPMSVLEAAAFVAEAHIEIEQMTEGIA